ncbi:MAG TPA: pentapeptide repeat-containing protein [Oculatellaceae cyanobacterium]|jgi:hypothetical protein
MLQTPTLLKGRRPLLGKLSMDAALYGSLPYITSRPPVSYLGLPAKYSGIPNFQQYRIGPGAELQCAILSNADLRWGNFRSANLKSAKLKGSILWGATLTNADLTGADISYADFTGADLVGANLTNVNYKGTCFLGARYSKTTRFPRGFGNPKAKGLISLDDSLQIPSI